MGQGWFMSNMKRNLYIEIACAILILLFAYTASGKIVNHSFFKNTMYMSIPGHRKGAAIIAWLVPVTELIIVLLLLFQQTKIAGLYSSLILLTGFTGYILYMILSRDNLPCSCVGVISKLSWKQHIFFNLFFIAISTAGIISYKRMVPAKVIT